MRTLLFVSVLVLAACGGSSSTQGGSRGDGSNGGDAGDESGGSGGTAGIAGTAAAAATSGTAGVASGANGGAGARGGASGDAGEPSQPTGGVGNGGAGARGGTAGTDVTGGTAGAGATPAITSCSDTFRFEGVWEGNVLDFYFEPIEAVRMVVRPDEELGGYQATIAFGSGDPPPPVTSGDAPYPNAEFWGDGSGGAGFGTAVEPWPDFEHSVVRGAGCDAVLRVSISSAEPWNEWCTLQEPVYTDGYGWGCTYLGGGSSGGGMCTVQDNRGQELATYPLWKCQSCGTFGPEGGVCGCTEEGCSFNRTPTHTFNFEGTVDSVISGPDPRCGDCTVRLTRVEFSE